MPRASWMPIFATFSSVPMKMQFNKRSIQCAKKKKQNKTKPEYRSQNTELRSHQLQTISNDAIELLIQTNANLRNKQTQKAII